MIKVKDYLINTTHDRAQILYPDTNLKYEFNDIAEIDKLTFNLRETELKKQLRECNDKLLRGPIFILENQTNLDKSNMYRVFVNETTSKSEKYLSEFEKYIDERIDRVKNKEIDSSTKLELARTEVLDEYINEMLDEVIRKFIEGYVPVNEMISVRSLMPNDIATHIVKIKNDYTSLSVDKKEKELRHIGRSLSGYKALRNFLMEYIKLKNGEYGGLNTTLYKYSGRTIRGKYYPTEKIANQIKEDIKEKKLK